MTIYDLKDKMSDDDKNTMRELYRTKYIHASQHALFLMWMKYTGVTENVNCSKCRSRLLVQISKFLRIINGET